MFAFNDSKPKNIYKKPYCCYVKSDKIRSCTVDARRHRILANFASQKMSPLGFSSVFLVHWNFPAIWCMEIYYNVSETKENTKLYQW